MDDIQVFLRHLQDDLSAIDDACRNEHDEAIAAEIEDTLFFLEQCEPDEEDFPETLDDLTALCDELSESCAEAARALRGHVMMLKNNL